MKTKHKRDREQPEANGKLKRNQYEDELARLHVELVKLQQWVVRKGVKICIVFEGRDGAGKGGTIKAITERVSPRVFRVVALPAPTEREKSQMYAQRYIPHLPAAGEIVIFDRSWYNRAGVERVMGFCTEEQSEKFLTMIPGVERAMVESDIALIKYWLDVNEAEQTRRLEARVDDGRKVWKLSPMDLKSYSRWYDYARARCDVPGDRHGVGALVRGPLRRQASGTPLRHLAPTRSGSVRRGSARQVETAKAPGEARLQGAGLPLQVHSRTHLADGAEARGVVLMDRS